MHTRFSKNNLLRWLGSFTVVVVVHLGAAIVILNWSSSTQLEKGEPQAAIMVELAPLPVATDKTPAAAPVGELQELIERQQKQVFKPETEALPEPPKTKTAEAILPLQPDPIEDELEPKDEIRQEQQEQAPPAFTAPPEDTAAAPKEGAVSLAPTKATATWQSLLLGHLEHHKRYPVKSRRQRQEAVVYVRIKINRDGTLVDYKLERPSPYEALNQEGLALITRAQPLPPPQELIGETLEFVVPIQFSLRR